jgi:outer membrane lipoprotein-sorting protein
VKVKLVIVIILMLMFSSCGQNSRENIKSKLIEMKSYEAEVELTVYGDSTETRYIARQYYKYPDKLRLEIKEPSFLSGQVILYNAGKCSIYNPLINMELSFEGLKEEQDYISAGFLLRVIGEMKKTSCTRDTINGIEYTVIKGSVPSGNNYRSQVAVYFECLGVTPAYMNIMDSQGKVRVEIRYIEFKYNVDIKEDMFINAKPTEK